MAAYVVADIDVKDPVGYEEYKKLSSVAAIKYGAKFLIRGGKVETLEGDWASKRFAVIEFASVEQAKRWYDSAEYRKAREVRARTAVSRLILVEGA